MAIITKPNIVKGEEAIFSLSKSELSQHPLVIADQYLSDTSNWFRVNIVYKSSTGRQYEIVEFDALQNIPTGKFLVSIGAKDSFQVLTIEILDFDGGILKIPRSELNVADFDLTIS